MAIRSIPLFPLNLVLLPKMILPLHLFEERYLEMLAYCMEGESPFGIVLTAEANPLTSETSYHSVGCTAEFVRVEPAANGRYNVHVAGEERFRILDFHDGMSFRTALVETFTDDPCDPTELVPWVHKASELLTLYLEKHLEQSGDGLGDVNLPDDPVVMSFACVCVVPITMMERQHLLESTNTLYRLQTVCDYLSTAIFDLSMKIRPTTKFFLPMVAERFVRYRCRN